MKTDTTIGTFTADQKLRSQAGLRLPILPWKDWFGALEEHWHVLLGICILTPVVLLALFSPVLPLQGYLETDPSSAMLSPSLSHPFGTDKLGRDILSRTLAGAR